MPLAFPASRRWASRGYPTSLSRCFSVQVARRGLCEAPCRFARSCWSLCIGVQNVGVRSELDMASWWVATWVAGLRCTRLLNAVRTGKRSCINFRFGFAGHPSVTDRPSYSPPAPVILRSGHALLARFQCAAVRLVTGQCWVG